MTVAVVYGGTVEERGPSEKNARDIADALQKRGYDPHLFNFEPGIIDRLKEIGTEAVFLCTQGKGYGDGTFQAILENEGIPFTGSRMREACLINDKILCKFLFDKYGIATPRWDILTKKDFENESYSFEDFGFPFVAKAPTQGGSFGIELIRSREDITAIDNVFRFDDPILLEEYIEGNFYTVGIYESRGELVILPVVEGLDLEDENNALITFTGKYGIKENELSIELSDEIKSMAERVFEITHARGLARIDFMLCSYDKKPYVLEINAVPGLKHGSLMPQAAELAGIEYEDMIEDILKNAMVTEG